MFSSSYFYSIERKLSSLSLDSMHGRIIKKTCVASAALKMPEMSHDETILDLTVLDRVGHLYCATLGTW
jgi:hypothetical protein